MFNDTHIHMYNDTHEVKGTIFDIKEFTVHDGPGVRTTVFFKGCPLSCIWCHNPEGMDTSPTLTVRESACTRCGACRVPCEHEDCRPFGRCLHACPRGLVTVAGTTVTAGELAGKLSRANALFGEDGGVTMSGGEPLLQPQFAIALADCLHEHGTRVALQTSGFAHAKTFSDVLSHVDYVLFDLKLADDEAHRRYTGVSCKTIHTNLAHLQASGKPHVIRIPLIPGITDTQANLAALAALAGDSSVELMPYNPYAGAKYPNVGKTFRYREAAPHPVDLSQFCHAKLLS